MLYRLLYIFILVALTLPADNLVSNGDFENGTGNWDYPTWEKHPEPGKIVDTDPFAGKFCYCFGREDFSKTNYLTQPIQSFRQNTHYTLRMAIKGENIPSKGFYVRIMCFKGKTPIRFAGEKGMINLISVQGTFNWKEYTVHLSPETFPQESTVLCPTCTFSYSVKKRTGSSLPSGLRAPRMCRPNLTFLLQASKF